MSMPENISIFLPKFLSSESTKVLFNCLKEFPNNIDSRFYTSHLEESDLIYQGDGLKNMLVVNIPDTKVKPTPSIVLSNTCDIDITKTRFFNANIIYSPIFNLRKYKEKLLLESVNNDIAINNHIESIKKQEITQIFYLPELAGRIEESIIFFDRVCNCSNKIVNREQLKDNRLFTLSDYGAYLFLLKLSIHFTRIQDNVERKHGIC